MKGVHPPFPSLNSQTIHTTLNNNAASSIHADNHKTSPKKQSREEKDLEMTHAIRDEHALAMYRHEKSSVHLQAARPYNSNHSLIKQTVNPFHSAPPFNSARKLFLNDRQELNHRRYAGIPSSGSLVGFN